MRRKAVERFQILEERGFKFSGEFRQRGFGFADALDDFIFDVRDIHDVRDLEIFEFQITPDEIGEDERAPVADVREVINGRPAAIHPDFWRIERREFLDGARERVEQF
jgi:hypothetical protein